VEGSGRRITGTSGLSSGSSGSSAAGASATSASLTATGSSVAGAGGSALGSIVAMGLVSAGSSAIATPAACSDAWSAMGALPPSPAWSRPSAPQSRL
jgi:hypothetical protein